MLFLAVLQKNIGKGLKCNISASLSEGYVQNVTTTLRARKTAREQRRIIIGQHIHNNDAMRQIFMNIHNSSKPE